LFVDDEVEQATTTTTTTTKKKNRHTSAHWTKIQSNTRTKNNSSTLEASLRTVETHKEVSDDGVHHFFVNLKRLDT
jgi:hypothetical protein